MSRKPQTTAFWVGRLPHWEVEGGRYFVTVHLAGAIPEPGRERIRALAARAQSMPDHAAPDWLALQRRVFGEMEEWLDRAEWNPLLRRPDVAGMVVEALEHRAARGDWRLFEYVVMPTHVHLFAEIGRLKDALEDFKRWTGHRAARLLGIDGRRFWQDEWFDHWSRSDAEDERVVRYIRRNPERARLVERYLDWPYGSWSRSRLPGGT